MARNYVKTNFSKELEENYFKTVQKEFQNFLQTNNECIPHFSLDSSKWLWTNFKLQMNLHFLQSDCSRIFWLKTPKQEFCQTCQTFCIVYMKNKWQHFQNNTKYLILGPFLPKFVQKRIFNKNQAPLLFSYYLNNSQLNHLLMQWIFTLRLISWRMLTIQCLLHSLQAELKTPCTKNVLQCSLLFWSNTKSSD